MVGGEGCISGAWFAGVKAAFSTPPPLWTPCGGIHRPENGAGCVCKGQFEDVVIKGKVSFSLTPP